ncbi:MAG: SOS response-associated peptidase [Candidatus Binataceae bacterium]
MCGRFTLTRQDRREVAELLGVNENDLRDYRPRFNIAPTDQHFIVTSEFERRQAQPARWGLVNRWAKDRNRASQCINAKSETLEQRTTFCEAFSQRRCVVPADGFYEWTGPKAKRQPLWIYPRAGGLLLFAGLYESWHPEKDRSETTFTIVTCAANAVISEVHDRMPVVLDERAAEDWMNTREQDPLSLKRLLRPAAADLLLMRPASPLVNSVKNDGRELLEKDSAPNLQLRLI